MLVAKKVTVAIDFYSILFHTMQDIGYLQLFLITNILLNIFPISSTKEEKNLTGLKQLEGELTQMSFLAEVLL